MEPEFRIQRVDAAEGPGAGFRALYESVFPAWEREPCGRILERVAGGRYRLILARQGEALVGLALLDSVPEPRYDVLTFLAVSRPCRGRGLGHELLARVVSERAGIVAAAPLFVECEDSALCLYTRFGFQVLCVDYRVPLYNDASAEQRMRLLVYQRDTSRPMDGPWVGEVVRHQFIDGYGVDGDDPRLRRQLRRIPGKVRIRDVRVQSAH